MSSGRKIVLGAIAAILLAAHVALFAAGGSWRTMGKALLIVDVISIWFVIGAMREFRKLDEGKAPGQDPSR
jgi:uncharacterized membrane protein